MAVETNINYLNMMENWFADQCNGVWEKKFSIKIDTIDNPGWSLRIDLDETSLKNEKFEEVRKDINENKWILCWVEKYQFQGGGGPLNLLDIFAIFFAWINKKNYNKKKYYPTADSVLYWLQKWYQIHCDGDWEHLYGVNIVSTSHPGWCIHIDIIETEMQDINFQKVEIIKSQVDWISCRVEEGIFIAQCSIYNLTQALQIFRRWVENSFSSISEIENSG